MISEYKKKKNEKLANKARKLYKEGLSMRDVGKVLNISHEWARLLIRNDLTKSSKK